MLMLVGIDDLILGSTASHPSSPSHSLPRPSCRLSSRATCADDYGWSGSTASVPILLYSYCRYPLVGFGFGYGDGRK